MVWNLYQSSIGGKILSAGHGEIRGLAEGERRRVFSEKRPREVRGVIVLSRRRSRTDQATLQPTATALRPPAGRWPGKAAHRTSFQVSYDDGAGARASTLGHPAPKRTRPKWNGTSESNTARDKLDYVYGPEKSDARAGFAWPGSSPKSRFD